jgi:hypothetical protein
LRISPKSDESHWQQNDEVSPLRIHDHKSDLKRGNFAIPNPFPEMVGLIVGLSCRLAGHRPIVRESDKTYGFLTRKKRPVKGTSIPDEPGGGRHHWVDSSSILRERTSDG